MKQIPMKQGGLRLPAIIQGCMRIANLSVAEADTLIQTNLELGVTMFDHADIYAGGAAETLFGKVLAATPSLRDKMIVQSKCCIQKGQYNASKQHILASVDGILSRLGIDSLDVLLMHRPDALMEPQEVAEAFDLLYTTGKVRAFGVSNQNPGQIRLLKKYVKQPLCFNQLQFSLTHTGMIDRGINVNTEFDGAHDKDGGVLDYCRLEDITIQAWSPFQYGFMEGVFLGHPDFPGLNAAIDEVAQAHNVTPEAIAIAWILRHPANMQAIVGSTKVARIRAIAKAAEVDMTREQWYELYRAADNRLP